MTEPELKQLNKTVTEAVNILKIYVGNSAQIKSMSAKQREAIDKWFDVTDMAEENQKRQRAFTERLRDENGRFIKKQEVQAKNFMGIANSIGGMFKKVTGGITASMTKLAVGITSNLKNFFQAVKNQFLSLFGEESEWFEIMSSIKDSITGFFGSIFTFLFRRTPAWAGKMIKSLQGIYNLQVKQMKMDFLDAGGKKKGGVSTMGLIGAAVFAIGAAIGAFLHKYFVLITKLPFFSKIATMFSKIDDIPFIGKLFKAVKFGFRWLGWPLTILLSAIDFIKAYSEAEGGTWDKIKAGMWGAIKGFIELPVKFIGWVTEKVLGWFGVEVDGIAEKIMGSIKSTFDMILEGWTLIFIQLKNIFGSALEWMGIKAPPGLSEGGQTFSINKLSGEVDKQKIIQQKEAEDAWKENLKRMIEEGNKKKAENTGAINKLVSSLVSNQGNEGGDVKQIPDELDNNVLAFKNHGGGMDE